MSTHILVVDDSHVERMLVEGLFRGNPDYIIELAEHGKEALSRIAACPPDLVLTDLVMPEMDGLELVRAVRKRYPEIPVILMTAHGDEATAVEALESGAASYVAKAQKAERMTNTVSRVLEQAAADRRQQRLAACTLEYHGRFALPNDSKLIRALVDRVQKEMVCLGFGDTVERIRVGEAFEESLLNAMYHGNLEIGREELARVFSSLDERLLDRMVRERCLQPHIRDRKILVVVELTVDNARFVIRDEGRGFNSSFVVGSESKKLASGRCRGMTLIRSLMDEVKFNQAGNELVMSKKVGSMKSAPSGQANCL